MRKEASICHPPVFSNITVNRLILPSRPLIKRQGNLCKSSSNSLPKPYKNNKIKTVDKIPTPNNSLRYILGKTIKFTTNHPKTPCSHKPPPLQINEPKNNKTKQCRSAVVNTSASYQNPQSFLICIFHFSIEILFACTTSSTVTIAVGTST